MPDNTVMYSADNVTTGKPRISGSIYRAKKTSTLVIPTSADATLSTDYKHLGYISKEGVKQKIERSSEPIEAWGGDTVADPQTGYKNQFSFKLIEYLNTEVQKAVHGDANVSGTALSTGISVKENAQEPEECVWIFDMILKNNTLHRKVVPSAKILEMDEIPFVDNEAIGYQITIGAHPDGSGDYVHDYFKTASSQNTPQGGSGSPDPEEE